VTDLSRTHRAQALHNLKQRHERGRLDHVQVQGQVTRTRGNGPKQGGQLARQGPAARCQHASRAAVSSPANPALFGCDREERVLHPGPRPGAARAARSARKRTMPRESTLRWTRWRPTKAPAPPGARPRPPVRARRAQRPLAPGHRQPRASSPPWRWASSDESPPTRSDGPVGRAVVVADSPPVVPRARSISRRSMAVSTSASICSRKRPLLSSSRARDSCAQSAGAVGERCLDLCQPGRQRTAAHRHFLEQVRKHAQPPDETHRPERRCLATTALPFTIGASAGDHVLPGLRSRRQGDQKDRNCQSDSLAGAATLDLVMAEPSEGRSQPPGGELIQRRLGARGEKQAPVVRRGRTLMASVGGGP